MKTRLIFLVLFVSLAASAQTTFINHRATFAGTSGSLVLPIGSNTLFRVANLWGSGLSSGTLSVQFPGGPVFNANLFTITPDDLKAPILGPATVSFAVQGAALYVTAQYDVVNTTLPAQGLVVQPAGIGATMTLQVSTNLTTWTSATNGVYPIANVNRFFRMKLTL
jgi:hypothetical protein